MPEVGENNQFQKKKSKEQIIKMIILKRQILQNRSKHNQLQKPQKRFRYLKVIKRSQ